METTCREFCSLVRFLPFDCLLLEDFKEEYGIKACIH